MNDEQFFLANAYLDGELTADERRIAEADPEVMSEVERLRALRAELRDVPEAAPVAREAAIAAAMAEFRVGAARTGAEPAEAEPGVVRFRPRPAYAKYLAVAAALVAVAGLGIVVSQADLGGGDDDSSGVEDAAIAQSSAREEVLTTVVNEPAAGTGEPSAEAERAPADAATDDAAGDIAAGDIAAGGDADMMEEAAEESAEATAEAAAEPAFGADEGSARIGVPPGFDPDAMIRNEVELAIHGSYLLDQRDLGLLGPTPETRCDGNYDILATATYLLDGDDRSVYIAVNEFEGFVLALDSDTCTELANGALF